MTTAQIIHHTIFAMLAVVTAVSALKVATSRSVIHAAFWLFPVFAGIAGFYLYLDAQFLAAIQVLLYIGAILVLIIFAVTLTRNAADPDVAQSNGFGWATGLAALLLTLALVGAAVVTPWGGPLASIENILVAPGAPVTDVQGIGLVLLQQYLLPFEIASILLLAGMVGAIVLARKERTVVEPEPEMPATGDVEVGVREKAHV